MKSKILFFIIITFLVGLKWGYDYIYSGNIVEAKPINFQNNNSSFDSVNDWIVYKNKMLQSIFDNKIKVNNLKSAIVLEDVLVNDKLEKQIECIEFKNNQLEIRLNNYSLESLLKFQMFKRNFNLQMEDNNQLITDLIKKHQTILKLK